MNEQGDSLPVVVKLAKRVIENLYKWNEEDSLDDSRFVPLIRYVVDAVERQALDEGLSPETAEKAATDVRRFGVDIYVQLCRRNAPDEADEKEDQEIFGCFRHQVFLLALKCVLGYELYKQFPDCQVWKYVQ